MKTLILLCGLVLFLLFLLFLKKEDDINNEYQDLRVFNYMLRYMHISSYIAQKEEIDAKVSHFKKVKTKNESYKILLKEMLTLYKQNFQSQL